MGDRSSIEWTDATWNPVSGCSKVSQGCKNCYAEALFPRPYPGRKFTDVRCHPERLRQPVCWARPRRIFVNSMSDLFHEDVPFEFIDKVFAVMAETPRHTYQILTKRPTRMQEYLQSPDRMQRVWLAGAAAWPLPNVWLGISVEDQESANERIPLLLQTPAAVRFLSCEPLLGGVDLADIRAPFWALTQAMNALTGAANPSLQGIAPDATVAWVIVGGESGRAARPFNIEWARSLVAQCAAAAVPCFVKQLGAKPFLKRESSSTVNVPGMRLSISELAIDADLAFVDRKGGDWNEWPPDLRIREFPKAAA